MYNILVIKQEVLNKIRKYTDIPFDSKFKLFDSYTGKMLFICNCDNITEVKQKARSYDDKRDGNCFLELLQRQKAHNKVRWIKFECWNY